jgi:hypothetical protein
MKQQRSLCWHQNRKVTVLQLRYPILAIAWRSAMPTIYNALPSSLRKPVETSRFAHDLVTRSQRPLSMPPPSLISKSRFARLPQEPEDARMTGVTRSLQRRLLALNVQGTRLHNDIYLHSKTA